MEEPKLLTIESKAEAKAVLVVMEELQGAIYKTSETGKLRQTLNDRLRPELAELLGARLEGVEDKGAEIKKIIEEVQRLKTVRMKLSFEPSSKFLSEIIGKLREFLGKEVVVEIEVDRGIMGGVVLEVAGKFYDESLKRKFEEKYGRI